MTAPTHVAFAVSLGLLGGVGNTELAILAFGAVLPDIDHPQSYIGKILFFISMPLKRYFGHRKTIHGFFLWGLIILIGFLWSPCLLIGVGGLSHVFLDAFNVKGVQAFMPFFEQVCVLFKRKYRIYSASKHENFLLIVLMLLIWGGFYIKNIGGVRVLVGQLTGSYKIAFEQYQKKGLQICFMEGKLRWSNGKIENEKWQIIGVEGQGLAVWDGKRIIHLPKECEFLWCKLVCSDNAWQALKLTGWGKVKNKAFFYDGLKWKYASAGSIVFGQVIGEKLELDVVD